ncbi:MAG: polysaccharide export protein [Candidatus Omnitrophica bacterium]|nr:polysaccharide export protein [Candidatus Omnitrophota bacterium]
MNRWAAAFGLICLSLLCACATGLSPLSEPALEDVAPEKQDYRINPKDILEIKIYPDEELNREVAVSPRGTVNFPLLGEIQVAGLTVTSAEKKMTALLEKDYLVYPQVHIRVQQFHTMTVSILGEVNRPGPYNLESEDGETTLLEAIAMAGGFSNIANIKKIKIIRIEGGQKKSYRVNAEDIIHGKKSDVTLQANDIVVVEQSWF